MQTFQFEAMDATGQEIKDEINRRKTKSKRKQLYARWDTSLRRSPSRKGVKKPLARKALGKKRCFRDWRSVKTAHLAAFTRQLSILQNAGLPILRSLRILETPSQRRSTQELAD